MIKLCTSIKKKLSLFYKLKLITIMKKILLFSAVFLIGISSFAQERAIKQYGFWDNWFFQVQGGANYTLAEGSKNAKFSDMLTPKVQLGFGKFFSPYTGFRLSAGGWQSKNYNIDTRLHNNQNYFDANLDGLFNLTNILAPYRNSTKFNLYGILGVNYTHAVRSAKLGAKTDDFISPRGGFIAELRTSDVVSVNLEAAANLMSDSFNGLVIGSKYDSNISALLGLTFRFPQRGFEKVDARDPAEIAALNQKINDRQSQINSQQAQIDALNSQITDLKNKLAQKPEVIKKVSSETVLNAVVVFKLGSSKLEDNQEINIFNAAKYLQDNRDVNVVVTGYADKATGTPEINQRLSEQRAKAVADILVTKYGIDASRITTEASGDRKQPFQIDSWNRVVIFTAR